MRAVRSLFIALILGFALAPCRALADDNTADGELVQYVRNAKKSGQKPMQVEQTLIKAGWPPAAVGEAVAHIYGTSNAALISGLAAAPPSKAAEAPPVGPGSTGQTSNTVPAPDIVPTADLPPGDIAPPAGNIVPAGNIAPKDSAKKESPSPAPSATPQTPPAASQNGVDKAGRRPPYEYQIGAGDALEIDVWKEPEASARVVVRPDGMISTPLIKELQVVGLTPTQAEILITEKLVKVIQEPDVTVVVTGINSKKIYTIGAVKREGTIPYTYSMTVMQAIAEAGGLTDYAKRKKIYVLRNENGKESKLAFDYDEVLKGNHMELNIQLLPGDTLVVPH